MDDISAQHLPRDSLSNQKAEKFWYEMTSLNQKDLTGTYRMFHLRKEECAYFVADYGTFTTVDPILGTQSKSQQI